jgi:enolase-phosphatase E1
VVVYSSGSVAGKLTSTPADTIWPALRADLVMYSTAQRLLFKYTDTALGDMTPLFSGYYDTVNAGLKQEPSSYQSIIAKEGIEPEAWLFLSDNIKGWCFPYIYKATPTTN